MRIFVTNLETSKERRVFIQNQFSKLKMEFEFVDCVVGAKLSEEEIAEKCDLEAINKHNENVQWFNRGIIGCTLTNQNNYRNLLSEQLDYALFLEDDIVLPSNLKEILAEVESVIKPGDVILLFYMSWEPLILQQTEKESRTKTKFYIPQNPTIISGGSAMIVTKEAAEKMLKNNTPIHTTPDCWGYFKEQGCIDRLLCVYPLEFDTADFKSTMQLGQLKTVSNFIDRYKIFPVYQILKMRRKLLKRKKQNIVIQ